MLIQLFTNTEPPIQIIIEGRKYWFKPNEKGDLVCDVTEEHGRELCKMFPNTYRRYGGDISEPVTEIIDDDFDIEQELGERVAITEEDKTSEVTADADDTGADTRDTEGGKRPDIRPGHSRILQRGAAPGRKK